MCVKLWAAGLSQTSSELRRKRVVSVATSATSFSAISLRIHKFLPVTMDPVREKALHDYRKKLLEHAEVEGRLKESK